MKIAVIGAGISGLGAAWALGRSHDVTLYEAANYLGGHSNTVDVPVNDRTIPVDTGFIVYNQPNYPNLVRLFEHLAVPVEKSTMSFSVSRHKGAFEYAGNIRGLLAQRSNLLRAGYWRMLRDALRFYREAPAILVDDAGQEELTLGAFLNQGGYSQAFVDDHLLPMGAAIWSASLDGMLAFPAKTFVRFFHNHGLLSYAGQPQWWTVSGGSREYVKRIVEDFSGEVLLATPVHDIERQAGEVIVRDRNAGQRRFDHLVLACHADQALALLGRGASQTERDVLGAFRYETNRAVLHCDVRLMPKRRAVWASWNCISDGAFDRRQVVSLTYWMNSLQNIDRRLPIFVSLNPHREPAQELTAAEFSYDHPQFDRAALAAQGALPDIQGVARTWFCGSYCGYGFHEDGLQAGLKVAEALGAPAPWAKEVTPISPAAGAVFRDVPPEAAEAA